MSREERKRQTRKALLDAALSLIEQGQHFANISLREVAKNAGVVPTSFYRHFDDMAPLGLNLIDEYSVILRRARSELLASASNTPITCAGILELYFKLLTEHHSLFRFIQQCRTSEHLEIRSAIRHELKSLSNEVASELRASHPKAPRQQLSYLSELVVHSLFDSIVDVLDNTPEQESLLKDQLSQELEVMTKLLK